MNPIGGTEIQYNMLFKYVDNNLLNNFQITTSIPEKEPLSKDKINILWVQNSYDQPNLAPWFQNKSNHDKYEWYVFNSHWCAEKYRMAFQLPPKKCTVIKNAVDSFKKRTPYKTGEPLKIIFTSTPWRGLNVLLGAMQLIKNPLVTCDVYSSTKIYGSAFDEQNKKRYEPLFEQAKELKNVNYKGHASNEEILNNINNYHLYVYPNIWEETSCISAIEALGNGLHGIVTNYGALYETCSEWPTYIQYQRDYKYLSQLFSFAIQGIIEVLDSPGMHNQLDSQQNFYKKFYSWSGRKREWTNFLEGVLNARHSKIT